MNVRQLLVGLPEAGKSTFMAALWHALDAGRVPGSLRLGVVHGDQKYLNEIRDAWGSCRRLDRNRRGQGKIVSMTIIRPDDGGTVELVLPDPAGESFSDQWEFGRCPKEYVELARGASGALLFINPEKVNEGPSISQVILAADAAGVGRAPAEPVAGPRPWKPEFAGTQVQLVEILQALLREPFHHRRMPVGVIVSAWDRLIDLQANPQEWLGDVLPLLHQYLRASGEVFPSRVYGISAQGGDLEADREKLLGEVEPWRRVKVEGPDCGPHDITAPIRWLMGVGAAVA